mgnify:CR=1 FL=1
MQCGSKLIFDKKINSTVIYRIKHIKNLKSTIMTII